ncbi:MAG: ATP-binding protein [Candidatus Limnocylindrales bacterium]
MSRFDPSRLRWRLLAANLAVAGAGVIAVAAGVWLAAPRAFDDAMGRTDGVMNGGGMMGGGSSAGMMDPIMRTAFGDAVGASLVLGLVAAVLVAIAASVLVATHLARPIDELATASRRVARGDYGSRVPAAEGELGELAMSFNEMAEALGANEQRRRDLIGDVAHELRTPIASVRGYVEGLAAGVFQPGPEAWRVLDEQTARLEHLVDDLALLWRAESNDLRLVIEPLDAQALLEDAAARHRGTAVTRGATIGVRAMPPLRLQGDRARLGQVLDNLVGNALRHGGARGTIELGATVEAGMVMVAVRDDGPGLTLEQAARVFDRFYRADPSRSRDAGGSGLGLTISKSLVEAMGGTIAAASPGERRGSTFTVRLPEA